MKRVYPVFIRRDDASGQFLVFVPDFTIYTEGNSLSQAIYMARDAIGLAGIAMEDDGRILPAPSTYEGAIEIAKKDADDVFDYSLGILTLVDVDFEVVRRREKSRMVRRNTTIPSWMSLEAERLHINVSQVLQEALAEKIKAMG